MPCPECGQLAAAARDELLRKVGSSAMRLALHVSEKVREVTGPGFSVDYSEGRGQVLKVKRATLGKTHKPAQSKVFPVVVDATAAHAKRKKK